MFETFFPKRYRTTFIIVTFVIRFWVFQREERRVTRVNGTVLG